VGGFCVFFVAAAATFFVAYFLTLTLIRLPLLFSFAPVLVCVCVCAQRRVCMRALSNNNKDCNTFFSLFFS